jgi:hypothetical protein
LLADTAVVFVSHNEAQIHRICDRAIMLAHGRMECDGTPSCALSAYRRSCNGMRPGEMTLVDERVQLFRLQVTSSLVAWGDHLLVNANLTTTEELRIGHIIIHLARDGDFIGNGELVFSPSEPFLIRAGFNPLEFKLGPLHLQCGRYSLSIALFDDTRKKTILHCLHFAEIDVEGPVGSGNPHLMPLQGRRLVGG